MKSFINCCLFDPYTYAVHENVSFTVSDGRIVDLYLNEEHEPFTNPTDLQGKIVVPGFIDAHMHCESTLLLPSHVSFLAEYGTLVCVADPHEITNVLGKEGFDLMTEDSKNALIDFRFVIPSCVPCTNFETTGGSIKGNDIAEILAEDEKKAFEIQQNTKHQTNGHRVIGLGEVMNVPGVLCGAMDTILTAARQYGTHIDGHAPVTSGSDLCAYISSGVQTDHECTTGKELRDRLSRGMSVLIREGTAGHNAKVLCTELAKLHPSATRNCAFCTDDRRIDDILESGHIDNAIRIAIDCGIDPKDAICMATLNPAIMFNLKDYGSITPGKYASFVVLEGDISYPKVFKVYVKGNEYQKQTPNEVIIKNKMLVDLPKFKANLAVAEFKGPAIGIIPNQLTTTSQEPNSESKMLIVLDRYTNTSEMGYCYINGIQLNKDTAVASTVAHDSHNIVCVGTSKAAIERAIEAIVKCGGGYTVASGEKVTSLPLPVGGLMTDRSIDELLQQLKIFREALLDAGASDSYDLMMTLSFMCLPVIPKLKLTTKGLFDAESFQFVNIVY